MGVDCSACIHGLQDDSEGVLIMATRKVATKSVKLMPLWLVAKGRSKGTIRAPDFDAALKRAQEIGFSDPDSLVLDDGVLSHRKNPKPKGLMPVKNPKSSDVPSDFSQSSAKVYGRAWSDAKQASAKNVGDECVVRLTWRDGEWLQMIFDNRDAALKTLHRLGFKE